MHVCTGSKSTTIDAHMVILAEIEQLVAECDNRNHAVQRPLRWILHADRHRASGYRRHGSMCYLNPPQPLPVGSREVVRIRARIASACPRVLEDIVGLGRAPN
jgi:protein associated with RNAse G/E